MLTSGSNFSLPREIPFSLRLAVFFGQVQVPIGLAFCLVGLIAGSIFSSQSDWSTFSFKGNEPKTKGVITLVEPTNSSENHQKIYRYAFSFAVNGKSVSGESYLPGSPSVSRGDTVPVEYLPAEPAKARIEGMRSAPFEAAFTLVFLIQPFVGIGMLLFGISRARKNIYLLRNGILTYGEVTAKEPTSSRINKQRVYLVHFLFKVNAAEHRASVRTHRLSDVLDEKKEALVYDAQNPEKAVLLDALPKAVKRFFQNGNTGLN